MFWQVFGAILAAALVLVAVGALAHNFRGSRTNDRCAHLAQELADTSFGTHPGELSSSDDQAWYNQNC